MGLILLEQFVCEVHQLAAGKEVVSGEQSQVIGNVKLDASRRDLVTQNAQSLALLVCRGGVRVLLLGPSHHCLNDEGIRWG